jgi:DNA-binding CsgD family transcriptional regulator
VEVACRLVLGATNKQIAADLRISPHTARDHVSSLFTKFGVKTRSQLAVTLSNRRQLIGDRM